MIHEKDIVEDNDGRQGIVLRTNWSDQAEVEWKDGTVSMCDLNELVKLGPATHLAVVYNLVPQLRNMARTWSDERWVISKPIVSPELTLKNRIKNAWSVFRGKAFTVKWYE